MIENLIIFLVGLRLLLPVIAPIAIVVFTIYIICNHKNTKKTRKASQILFYITGSLYFISKVFRLK